MKRRDFLERVSDLANGAVAGITLSKVQIAAVAASLATVVCTKENLINIAASNVDIAAQSDCTTKNPYSCGKAISCAPGCTISCSKNDTCFNPFNCYFDPVVCGSYDCTNCGGGSFTGASGGTH